MTKKIPLLYPLMIFLLIGISSSGQVYFNTEIGFNFPRLDHLEDIKGRMSNSIHLGYKYHLNDPRFSLQAGIGIDFKSFNRETERQSVFRTSYFMIPILATYKFNDK